MDKNLKIIPVSSIFTNIRYVVPIYQRNYAWGVMEIEQLIEDIDSSINDSNKNYFLGNLIVNQTDNNVYEVIDGQQRLTTLFLLENYLGMNFAKDALRFEAREKSNRTLNMLTKDNNRELVEELVSVEILKGHQIIDTYFKTNNIDKNELIKKLEKVFLVRVQVPQGIDLNHYFEIMNTRGEQLELHEIAKAKFLEVLDTEHDKKTAALIWEKCSNMDSYIQMNFDPKIRKSLFTNDWTSIKDNIADFDSISECVPKDNEDRNSAPLIEILKNKKLINNGVSKDEVENERFESIISFPNFLLQVNAVINKLEEEDSTLDDKHFLNNLSWAWNDAGRAKNFLYHMLKCRVLFDKYILKREYARDYKETGKWSLQRLEKYSDVKGDKPKYVGTFGDDNSQNNKQIRTLQSCLRITYTSPKTMHWISLVLTGLIENELCDIIEILEDYCKTKVIESRFEDARGFGFERIVFTYLDYLLYKNGYSYLGKEIVPPMRDDWQFQFRSSIEHFQPQNPVEGLSWESDDLDGFGNLALITVSGNSKFSNLPPEGKISSYPSIIEQSLKLKIMKELVNLDNGKWTEEKASKHKEEMFRILNG
ncbi:DUF262 domain-containing protein [Clostridium aciditolerans]|jgi:uncharacterized protein with ParB-like and HNH nuclease domain|uniref:DUF262 domain-containing protein n=1 Tax=Clostridium aciditolerans TaxID=339861 RepID=A0A934HYD4_9CLOT|nr:DUF262 domain-containing protein [Clostridium aciditolerans]MBI6873307.1 DUF262 domain-containing protein [Clostridium aciditolerans]